VVILIPARGGSKRIPGKALKLLGGKPLIAWTIETALSAHHPATVCSEDGEILHLAERCGAQCWTRPMYTASDDAPDITWLSLALHYWPDEQEFMIRRPTSPFVSATTMQRAARDFGSVPEATAMRAMRPVTEHLNKMWERRGVWMKPASKSAAYSKGLLEVEPWSMPTQQLATVYVQTAGLEIIRRSTLESGSLTGDRLLPLFLEGPEALDINTPDDWARAEEIAKTWTPS
jgi:CMP-N,N'-diacetyllegionaminic acid synthase